jgi:SAM-dependent methyltransferase
MAQDAAKTWHYGLAAEVWAALLRDTPELDYYRGVIARYGEPVLDVACGTGRLLLPLLAEGVDIDGVDVSADMLGALAERAAAEGLEARVFAQPMYALDLPRRYRTIYMCGSFGITGGRDQDLATLRAIYEHLERGGVLLFNKDVPYVADADEWSYWLPQQRTMLPEAWGEWGARREVGDGRAYASLIRLLDLDPLDPHVDLEMWTRKWVEGTLVAEEKRALRTNLYLKPEIELMLQVAGFAEIAVYGGYTQQAPTAKDEDLVYLARKGREG